MNDKAAIGGIKFKDLDDDLKAMIGAHSTIVNHADGEDLTTRCNVLKFANRYKETFGYVYRGYIILRRNIGILNYNKDGKALTREANILTQDMINDEDTIYEVRYDFDLNGNDLTLPENCVLYFNGGRFTNGSVDLNGATIEGTYNKLTLADKAKIVSNCILYNPAPGTTRWTEDGIEWWNGKEWFNPYIANHKAFEEGNLQINEKVNVHIAENKRDFVNVYNAIADESKNRQDAVTKVRNELAIEIDNRMAKDQEIQKSIDETNATHAKDKNQIVSVLNNLSKALKEHEADNVKSFDEVIAAYKAADDELRELIVRLIKEEHDDRVSDVAKDIEKVRQEFKLIADNLNDVDAGLRVDVDNMTRHIDTIADRVNNNLTRYDKILDVLQRAIIDNQNRIDKLRDRIVELEDNANKYHVRFRMADGKLIGGQYVKSGEAAIAPELPEGATYDKEFNEVYEDLLINVTV